MVLKLVGPESSFEGVWHWNSASLEGEPNFYWLADSFYEFLSMLVYDVCAYEEERETLPLFQAVERGAITTVEQYLALGGNVDARNEHGHTLLMAAAWHQWPRIVRLLLNHSADPNARDNSGKTPLHHAAVSSVDSVKLLLAAGADATARDHKGRGVLGEWSYRADQILRCARREGMSVGPIGSRVSKSSRDFKLCGTLDAGVATPVPGSFRVFRLRRDFDGSL